jgi:hypothetical protein
MQSIAVPVERLYVTSIKLLAYSAMYSKKAGRQQIKQYCDLLVFSELPNLPSSGS